jgi:hypothetical protein
MIAYTPNFCRTSYTAAQTGKVDQKRKCGPVDGIRLI